MSESDDTTRSADGPASGDGTAAATARPRRRAASRPAGPPALAAPAAESAPAPRKRTAKKAATAEPAAEATTAGVEEKAPAKAPRKRTTKKATSAEPVADLSADAPAGPAAVLFQQPDLERAEPAPRRTRKKAAAAEEAPAETATEESSEGGGEDRADEEAESDEGSGTRRRRRRGGRGRRGRGGRDTDNGENEDEGAAADATEPPEGDEQPEERDEEGAGTSSSRRRRRRRRGGGSDAETSPDDPPNTVVRVREPRGSRTSDEVTGVRGSTRLEAKKQRRREGREQGRRRQPILTEAEFLARRESVDRVMIVRQTGDRTQIAVLEDGMLAEHYVNKAEASSFVGNVYLGRVQNVLPSMEAAFVDIGKGRNAVLYAGEVNWDAAGLEGQPRRIEHALKSGDQILVQVTKDPIGHKGARLTAQVSLPGRFLVYVPDGSMTGISRKLPDTERTRLKQILKAAVPEGSGVIVRTAAEGASEDELSRDVARLKAQWEDIEKKAKTGSAPALLYGEPDLVVRVLRDVFNEDVKAVIVSGDDAWDMVQPYVAHVAPDLLERVSRWTEEQDVFAAHRVDEQLAKALDRKVWLPSGGSLVIDRTEAMTVIDVNTGKFTGSGGNLEETVTKNNLEAAEEIVRQLRLRDVGGIIVVDFIDMVLESNRDLVLRRLLECLARDRTKHQVAEVTSLGLVQMTRKRVGQGLLEAFSVPCDHCGGRGVMVQMEPVELKGKNGNGAEGDRSPRRKRSEKVAKPKATKAAGSKTTEAAESGDRTEPLEEAVAAVD